MADRIQRTYEITLLRASDSGEGPTARVNLAYDLDEGLHAVDRHGDRVPRVTRLHSDDHEGYTILQHQAALEAVDRLRRLIRSERVTHITAEDLNADDTDWVVRLVSEKILVAR